MKDDKIKRRVSKADFTEIIWKYVIQHFSQKIKKEFTDNLSREILLTSKGRGIIDNDIRANLNNPKINYIPLNKETLEKFCTWVVNNFSEQSVYIKTTSILTTFDTLPPVINTDTTFNKFDGVYFAFFIRSEKIFINSTSLEEKINSDYILHVNKTGIEFKGTHYFRRKERLNDNDFFDDNVHLHLSTEREKEGKIKEFEKLDIIIKIPKRSILLNNHTPPSYLAGVYVALEEEDSRQPVAGTILFIKQIHDDFQQEKLKALNWATLYFKEFIGTNDLVIRALKERKMQKIFLEGKKLKTPKIFPLIGSWYIYTVAHTQKTNFELNRSKIIIKDPKNISCESPNNIYNKGNKISRKRNAYFLSLEAENKFIYFTIHQHTLNDIPINTPIYFSYSTLENWHPFNPVAGIGFMIKQSATTDENIYNSMKTSFFELDIDFNILDSTNNNESDIVKTTLKHFGVNKYEPMKFDFFNLYQLV